MNLSKQAIKYRMKEIYNIAVKKAIKIVKYQNKTKIIK